jgi:hypothetical protein
MGQPDNRAHGRHRRGRHRTRRTEGGRSTLIRRHPPAEAPRRPWCGPPSQAGRGRRNRSKRRPAREAQSRAGRRAGWPASHLARAPDRVRAPNGPKNAADRAGRRPVPRFASPGGGNDAVQPASCARPIAGSIGPTGRRSAFRRRHTADSRATSRDAPFDLRARAPTPAVETGGDGERAARARTTARRPSPPGHRGRTRKSLDPRIQRTDVATSSHAPW